MFILFCQRFGRNLSENAFMNDGVKMLTWKLREFKPASKFGISKFFCDFGPFKIMNKIIYREIFELFILLHCILQYKRNKCS